MWIFIFVLVAIPLFFFWSDNLGEVIPKLKPYLPEEKTAAAQAKGPDGKPVNALPEGWSLEWVTPDTEAGYVSWVGSTDGQWRLAVGCREGEPPTLGVTRQDAQPAPAELALALPEVWLPLKHGTAETHDVIGPVSQVEQTALVGPAGTPVAQFSAPAWQSQQVARNLQQHCR